MTVPVADRNKVDDRVVREIWPLHAWCHLRSAERECTGFPLTLQPLELLASFP